MGKGISIAARKQKGRRLQQYVRDMILAFFPLEADDVRSASMGMYGVDLQLSPKARKHFNYDVECKHDENRSVWHCFEQAKNNALKGKALLIMKKNHTEPLAIMKATDMFRVLTELDRLKNPSDYVNALDLITLPKDLEE